MDTAQTEPDHTSHEESNAAHNFAMLGNACKGQQDVGDDQDGPGGACFDSRVSQGVGSSCQSEVLIAELINRSQDGHPAEASHRSYCGKRR